MAGIKTPTGFTAGRTLSLEGVVYAVGAAVPPAVVARVKSASALIGRGFLIPNVERRGRVRLGKRERSTASFTPRERRTLGA